VLDGAAIGGRTVVGLLEIFKLPLHAGHARTKMQHIIVNAIAKFLHPRIIDHILTIAEIELVTVTVTTREVGLNETYPSKVLSDPAFPKARFQRYHPG
jgi:hypothetical protein